MHSSLQSNTWHVVGTQELFAKYINKLLRKDHEIAALENIKYILRGMRISVIKSLNIRELFILWPKVIFWDWFAEWSIAHSII